MSSTIESSVIARDPLQAVSNGMVQLFKDAFGRGPRRARTSFAGSDSLVVVLEQTMTTAERKLIELGEGRRLREVRMVIQAALEPRARTLVEEILGRRTVAFATGLDPERDVAAMFFTLGEPLRSARRPQWTHSGG